MIYTTLEKKELDLAKLNPAHKDLLKKVYEMYQTASFGLLHNLVFETDCLKKMGAKKRIGTRYYVDEGLTKSFIYKVVIDLVDRKAIEEGLLGLDKNSNADFSKNKKSLEDFLG